MKQNRWRRTAIQNPIRRKQLLQSSEMYGMSPETPLLCSYREESRSTTSPRTGKTKGVRTVSRAQLEDLLMALAERRSFPETRLLVARGIVGEACSVDSLVVTVTLSSALVLPVREPEEVTRQTSAKLASARLFYFCRSFLPFSFFFSWASQITESRWCREHVLSGEGRSLCSLPALHSRASQSEGEESANNAPIAAQRMMRGGSEGGEVSLLGVIHTECFVKLPSSQDASSEDVD
ncbi:uncharacterized [Tachysurus ichikawai]